MDNTSARVPKMLLTILPKCQIIDVREDADGLQIRKFDWKDLANVISGKAVAWVSDTCTSHDLSLISLVTSPS